jgi:hypothetical protein
MELHNFKDFYIDLNGDVKANNGEVAEFITETNKLNSKYIKTESIDEIKKNLSNINPNFELDVDILKQYSLKYNTNEELCGIKLYVDYSDNLDGLDMVLMGLDITKNNIDKDYYFLSDIHSVNNFISKHNLNYEIKEFETHQPVLYSVKYNVKNEIINFKTYYVINENSSKYDKKNCLLIKSILKFN